MDYLDKLNRIIDKKAAIEIAHSRSFYDKAQRCWRNFAALYVVVEKPSEQHSNYSEVELCELELDALSKLKKIGKGLSKDLEVPFYCPDITESSTYHSRWKDSQRKNKIAWKIEWLVRYWDKTGEKVEVTGCSIELALDGKEANRNVENFLKAEFPNPKQYKTNNQSLNSPTETWSRGGISIVTNEYVRTISSSEFRELILKDGNYTENLKAALGKAPSMIDLMMCLFTYFDIELENQQFMYDWARSVISDESVGINLKNAIDSSEDKWRICYELRKAYESGHKPSDFLKEYDWTGSLAFALLKEFHMGTSVKKLSHWLNHMTDEQFDKLFNELVKV